MSGCAYVCVCCVGVINKKEGERGVERRESARVREAYVHITRVWLPRRPCKLGLALASIDPLLECVSVCLCVGTHTYTSCIWGMPIHVHTYVSVHITCAIHVIFYLQSCCL